MPPADYQRLRDRVRGFGGGIQTRIDEIVADLGIKAPSIATAELAAARYRLQMERAQSFASISNLGRLSPTQLDAFNTAFTDTVTRLDRYVVNNTPESRRTLLGDVDRSLSQLATLSPDSPSASQRRAAYQALLATFAPNGIALIPDDPFLSVRLQNQSLRSSVLDGSAEGRQLGAQIRSEVNRAAQIAVYEARPVAGSAIPVLVGADGYLVPGAKAPGTIPSAARDLDAYTSVVPPSSSSRRVGFALATIASFFARLKPLS